MLQLPELYSNHLKKQFSYPQYLVLIILLNLLQNGRTVRLEELARRFPCPILLRSRIKKLQRFLSLQQFQIATLWLPILKTWITQEWKPGLQVHLVLDRSQWRDINLLMVSLVYDRRAIPVYFWLLSQKGNSNLAQQKQVLEPALTLFKKYKVIVLGDREFCGVELARWLAQEQRVYLCLRLRKNEYVDLEDQLWFQLRDLGLSPGISFYYQGVKVTKARQALGFNLAVKWKRNYRHRSATEPWFLMTNLDSLSAATAAYAQRMGIEEMFRDFKLGGYNLEGTQVGSNRLLSLILLVTLSYCCSTFSGQSLKRKGVAHYVGRSTEPSRRYRRHSSFSIGLYAQTWLDSLSFFHLEMQELLSFCPHKRSHYLRGLRAASLIHSAL